MTIEKDFKKNNIYIVKPNLITMRLLFNLKTTLSVLFIVCATLAYAQKRTISGTVVDVMGDPIVGAAVTAQVPGGSPVGVVTNLDGEYSISLPDDVKMISVSYIGFEKINENIGGRSRINFILKESSVFLDEVVAIGYAKVQRKDLTSATSSVAGKDLASMPVTSAAQALQGKVSGVNIVSQSGAPGAGVNITVRGGTSITQSTKPLYIVDGFEMENALDNININDIESVDVLKDASATAIYGARGSNGIILITTKSAQKGKTQISYNSFYSFDVLSKKLDVLTKADDFARYQYEIASLGSNPSLYSTFYDNMMDLDDASFYSGVYDRINSRYAGAQTIDWQDELFGGTALNQSHNVNIMTGNEKTQAMVSYNYNNQDGLLAHHGITKNSVRAKVNSELYKGIRFDMNTSFISTETDGGGAYSGMKSVVLQPIIGGTMFSLDDLLNTQTYLDYSSANSAYDTANPLVQNNASRSNMKNRLFSVNAGIEIDFLKCFTWRTAGSYTWANTKSTSFADENSTAAITDPDNTGINGSIKFEEFYRYQIANTLSFNKKFKRNSFSALLGQEVTYKESESTRMTLIKFPYPNFGLDNIDNATVKDKSTSRGRNGILSFFGRVNYNFDERYLLTATMRADGSSKFAPGNKWGYFPSASGAWRISEESFWKNSSITNVMNSLKLRAGYGTTGNCNISDYMYVTSILESAYPMNNQPGNAVYINGETLGNGQLKWETLGSTNIGLDISFFNSRLNISAEWYNNQANNLLMKSVVPSSTGYKDQYQNVAKMRNRGFEVTINSVNIRSKGFTWTSDLNLTFNRSKVLRLETDDTEFKEFSQGSNRSGQVFYYATVGESLGAMYGYKYEGVYTTDDFITDSNGKFVLKEGVVKPKTGTVQPGDIKFAADSEDNEFGMIPVKIGNGAPVCVGGFSNNFAYKGFDLGIYLQFSIGNDVYNATKHSMSPYSPNQNVPTEFGLNYYRNIDPETGRQATTLARLKELNPDESSRVWAPSTYNTGTITYANSYFVEDGSYLRIGQISLGYTIPPFLTKKAYISNARIYFTANNVATITGYSGYDPDVSSANDQPIITPGYDSSAYPRARSFVFGLNLTF